MMMSNCKKKYGSKIAIVIDNAEKTLSVEISLNGNASTTTMPLSHLLGPLLPNYALKMLEDMSR